MKTITGIELMNLTQVKYPAPEVYHQVHSEQCGEKRHAFRQGVRYAIENGLTEYKD
jgi:hypothetical protein